MKSAMKLVILSQLVIMHGLSYGQNIFPMPSGSAGVGTNTPAYLFEVEGGDINLKTTTAAYRLAGGRFLWHNGNSKNVFVGIGTSNATHSGAGNTFVGNAIGALITSATDNTFVGLTSGTSHTSGNFNSFFGAYSGKSNTTGAENAFFGKDAGFSMVTGSFNTAVGTDAGSSYTGSNNSFFGYEAGLSTTTGIENTFLGYQAGRNNVIGRSNTIAGFEAGKGVALNSYDFNCFYGSNTGRASTTGDLNTFVGYNCGPANTTGTLNVFVGAGAGSNNTEGSANTFVGYLSGMSNANVGTLKGANNTFIGYHAGRFNITGQGNTAVGMQAGRNSTAGANVFVGQNSGYYNTSGGNNTAIGFESGEFNATGSNNTYIGHGADANGNNYGNAAAIGSNTVVTASNKMFFGNASVVACYNSSGDWLGYSDGRFKFNVNENVSGLDFIKRLRPVTYQMNTAELDAFMRANMTQAEDSIGAGQSESGIDFGPSTAMIRSGFIAQEVEQAAIESGFISSIVSTPTHENEPYALSYGQFVVPLVKAVQEQQETIENQNERMGQLEETLAQMQGLLEQCCTTGAEMRLDGIEQGQALTTAVELGSADGAILYQNRPNPFTEGTVINYYLPKSVKVATMVFLDNAGQTIKETVLTDKGNASVTVQPNGLAAGVYTYSLIVDGKTVETRRMVKGN